VMVALLVGAVYLFRTPGWARFLEGFEEQGWFTQAPYKGNQGVRMRRATVLGALVLGFSGIITMVNHRAFGSERLGANDWYWTIPFTSRTVDMDRLLARLDNGEPLSEADQNILVDLIGTSKPDAAQLQHLHAEQVGRTYTTSAYIPLMFKLHLVLPVVFALLLLWFAYRLVNAPQFADFLVATEAEMNKVSWTTRRRLVQDTIVVLVTVFLMTVFLFFIDILWIKILSGVGVLQVDVKAQLQKQQEKSQW
jgi:preprotein translocase SecE subunit